MRYHFASAARSRLAFGWRCCAEQHEKIRRWRRRPVGPHPTSQGCAIYRSLVYAFLACSILLAAGCDLVTGPGTLAGTVRYAKDPAEPLTDTRNAGDPAAGVKVSVYGTEAQGGAGDGVTVYMENQVPAKETITDERGRYQVELPSGHYVVRLAPDPKLYHRFVDIGPNRTSIMDFIILRSSNSAAPTPTPGQ